MSRAYKNTLNLRGKAYGQERRKNLAKEILKDSTPLPKTLLYKDIDKAFSEWVENDLHITFEGEVIPTMSLYSNQRFSEYMQTWEGVDEKKNIIFNFKSNGKHRKDTATPRDTSRPLYGLSADWHHS